MHPSPRKAARILAVLAALTLTATACSSDGEPATTEAPTTTVDALSDAGCVFEAEANYWDCWGPDFQGVDFTGVDLTGVDLAGATLFNVDFTDATLKDADLSGSRGLGADFTRADLTGADLGYGEWSSSSFVGANLSGADLTGAHLDLADFTGANLSGADLGDRFLPGVIFVGADLTGADLSGAHLSGANFTGADLTGADLTGAHLGDTDYTVGEFAADNWTGPDELGSATFVDATLTGASICAASLLDVDLPQDSGHVVADDQECTIDPAPATTTTQAPSGVDLSSLTGRIVFTSTIYGFDYDDPAAPWQVEDEASCLASGGTWHSWLSVPKKCSQDTEIFIMNPDGSDLQQLTDNDLNESDPEISPDGSRIVYSDRSNIFVMNDDGSDVQELTQAEDGDERWSATDPTWSPDGAWIAFVMHEWWDKSYTDTHNSCYPCAVPKIHVMRDDGTEHRQLTFNDQAELDAGQALDAEYHLEGSGSDPEYLNAASDTGPAWSPDGTHIAFLRYRPIYFHGVVVIATDGSDMSLAYSSGSTDNTLVGPEWTPDGTSIAVLETEYVLRTDEYESTLLSVTPDGLGSETIPIPQMGSGSPRISSFALSQDGRAVVANVGQDDRRIQVWGIESNPIPTGVPGSDDLSSRDLHWGG